MTFGLTTTSHTSFDEAVEQTTRALAPGEAMDPQIMVRVVDQPGLRDVADQAAAKLAAAISALGQPVEAK
jgi:predicted ATPase with chaperone activity